MKRLLLILAVVAAQLLAGPNARVASAELSGTPTIAREGHDAIRLEAQVASARHGAAQVARTRTRSREQRTTWRASVATRPMARFASIVAYQPATEGTINHERFAPLGLPDTRAP